MAYRVFEIPEFHEFVDALSIGPEPIEDEDAQRLVFTKDGEELVVTLDAPGRSAHVRWTKSGAVIIEAFREGAVGIRLTSSGATSALAVAFETDCERGELQIQVAPTFEMRDRLLLR